MRKKGKAGFSLVEVVFALGVAVFCLLPILGLLPIGMTANQDTIHQTTAASLAAAVNDDLHATPASQSVSPGYSLTVPAPGSSAVINTLYLSADGAKLAAPSGSAPTYLATVVLTPPAATALSSESARILITWPARANQVAGQIPTNYVGSFETVVGLDRY